MFVEGPVSLSEYKSDKWDMHIYLFGDYHEKKRKCSDLTKEITTIEKFLESTFIVNKKITIDFYLEEQFISRFFNKTNFSFGDLPIRQTDRESYLEDVSNYFSNCFQVIKTNCPYKNTRFHYVDVRFIPNSILVDIFLLTADITNFNKHYEKEEFVEKLLPSIKKDILQLYEKLNTVSLLQIFQETKISKQFKNIQIS